MVVVGGGGQNKRFSVIYLWRTVQHVYERFGRETPYDAEFICSPHIRPYYEFEKSKFIGDFFPKSSEPSPPEKVVLEQSPVAHFFITPSDAQWKVRTIVRQRPRARSGHPASSCAGALSWVADSDSQDPKTSRSLAAPSRIVPGEMLRFSAGTPGLRSELNPGESPVPLVG